VCPGFAPREEVVAGTQLPMHNPCGHSVASRLSDLELHRALRFALHDDRARSDCASQQDLPSRHPGVCACELLRKRLTMRAMQGLVSTGLCDMQLLPLAAESCSHAPPPFRAEATVPQTGSWMTPANASQRQTVPSGDHELVPLCRARVHAGCRRPLPHPLLQLADALGPCGRMDPAPGGGWLRRSLRWPRVSGDAHDGGLLYTPDRASWQAVREALLA
jgi:hypothetical protein